MNTYEAGLVVLCAPPRNVQTTHIGTSPSAKSLIFPALVIGPTAVGLLGWGIKGALVGAAATFPLLFLAFVVTGGFGKP